MQEQLNASELRVLETLDYRLPSLTPVDYIEALLKMLGSLIYLFIL